MNVEELIIFNANKMCEYYFYNYYKYPFTKRLNSFKEKNFKYFKRAAMSFMQKDGFNPEKFIFSVMMEEKQVPQQLYKESNWKLYLRNKAFFNDTKKEKKNKNQDLIDIIKSIKSGMSYLGNKKVSDIFNDKLRSLQFKGDNPPCDLILFYFSKAYNKWFFDNNPDSDGLSILGAKRTVEKYPLLIDKIKEFLKDDFLGSDETLT